RLPSISIDYGVMERSSVTRVIPSRFQWSDVGSWASAMDIYAPDADGNVVVGDATLIDARSSMVKAEGGRMVAVVGLDDVVVVDTPDALLVVRRDQSQSVKKVVEALRRKGRTDLL
ncbi:MAG: mannose-1-phosphate guanylyltransferase, partial [Myxococcota bacterium]